MPKIFIALGVRPPIGNALNVQSAAIPVAEFQNAVPTEASASERRKHSCFQLSQPVPHSPAVSVKAQGKLPLTQGSQFGKRLSPQGAEMTLKLVPSAILDGMPSGDVPRIPPRLGELADFSQRSLILFAP